MTLQVLFGQWTDTLAAISRIVIFLAAVAGIAFAARSLFLAHQATQAGEKPGHHLFAAVVAGSLTVAGVIAGWLSTFVAG